MKLSLYRLVVAPTLTIGLFFLSPFHRKIRAVLKSKFKKYTRPNWPSAPVWIHAASGEFEYAKPLIREIKKREPETPIVVTYSSTSYISAIESFKGVDAAYPLPLDLPGPCRSFLHKIRPKCLLIARTDFWPEMLYQCRQFHLPIILFAYTQKAPNQISWPARFLRRWVLSFLDQINCVSDEDVRNLQKLGMGKGFVAGDPRYDQVAFRILHPKPLNEMLRPKGPTLIAGSTWPEDEAQLVLGLSPLLLKNKLKLVMVPHEPTDTHLRVLERHLKQKSLTTKRYSQGGQWSSEHVLIVDQVGILADIYSWGQMAFVGGSFRKSVHSVMEPLGVGSQTFVGPHIANNREALIFSSELIGQLPAVQICSDGAELEKKVTDFLKSTTGRHVQIRKAFEMRMGASQRLYESIFTSVRPADDGLDL